ncbi:MAG: class I tRNA ligase family protein, partial [Gemmatimonadetes bacterium]|nr:class I tRNA ligase family protein [Gemmatimonadota bacterium]
MAFREVPNNIDFIAMEKEILAFWKENDSFEKLRKMRAGSDEIWSFVDGPITANNPMGVHHAWGRTYKDLFCRYHAMLGKDLRWQNGFDCEGLWVEVNVEKELGFETKRDIEEHGLEEFIKLCKMRVLKYAAVQTEQSIRLGYWMDWNDTDELRRLHDLMEEDPSQHTKVTTPNGTIEGTVEQVVGQLGSPEWGGSYFTFSDENNYTIWSMLKKLFEDGKIYKGNDVVPWSGKQGTSYSQMEIIDGRKLVAHRSVFVRFPLKGRENEFLLVWTTTPWTLTSNVAAAVNADLEYVKLQAADGAIYYFANENLNFQRLDKQFKEKKQWVDGVPKLKTIHQIFKERGGYEVLGTLKGAELVGLEYEGPFDELPAQNEPGGYPFTDDAAKEKGITSANAHRVIDGGRDSMGEAIVVAGEGTGIVHMAPGCGEIDHQIGKKIGLVMIAPLDEEAKYLDGFDWLTGLDATDPDTTTKILDNLKEKGFLLHVEEYPHVYPHCWRSGEELVFRIVDEWYINMDWRDRIKGVVDEITWYPGWGRDREMDWLSNMGDWMISKKRFWGLALPIWQFEDGSFYVVGSREELKELAVEGWDEFEGHTPHRPYIDKVKIRHPETGLVGTRIEDVGNPWLDAGIVPFSTLQYNTDRAYWKKWFPADWV